MKVVHNWLSRKYFVEGKVCYYHTKGLGLVTYESILGLVKSSFGFYLKDGAIVFSASVSCRTMSH